MGGRRAARARPTRGRRWPGSRARPAPSGSGTLMTLGHLPASRAARDPGRAGRPDERRPGGARARRRAGSSRSTRRTASRSRTPASASTGSRSSSPSSPGCGRPPEGELFSHAGEHYTLTDSPALPKPAQQPRPARASSAARASVVRRRWPRATPTSSTCRSSPQEVTATQFGRVRTACEDDRPRPRRAGVLQRAGAVLRRHRRRRTPPRRRDRPGRRRACARTGSPGRPPRWSTGSAGSPSSAPSGSTCRPSTSTTSTTSSSWPREVMPQV